MCLSKLGYHSFFFLSRSDSMYLDDVFPGGHKARFSHWSQIIISCRPNLSGKKLTKTVQRIIYAESKLNFKILSNSYFVWGASL